MCSGFLPPFLIVLKQPMPMSVGDADNMPR